MAAACHAAAAEPAAGGRYLRPENVDPPGAFGRIGRGGKKRRGWPNFPSACGGGNRGIGITVAIGR